MTIRAVNPTTGEIFSVYEEMTQAEVSSVIEHVHAAFLDWRKTRFDKRARYIKRAAQHLRERTDTYATLMAQEMGKPVKQGRAEVEKCA